MKEFRFAIFRCELCNEVYSLQYVSDKPFDKQHVEEFISKHVFKNVKPVYALHQCSVNQWSWGHVTGISREPIGKIVELSDKAQKLAAELGLTNSEFSV